MSVPLLDLRVLTLNGVEGEVKSLQFRFGALRFTAELTQRQVHSLLLALFDDRHEAYLPITNWHAPMLPNPSKAKYFDLTIDVLNPRRVPRALHQSFIPKP